MVKGIWLKGTDDIKDAIKIREKVFIDEQQIDPLIELDDKDPIAEHLVIYDGDIPAATGRLLLDNEYCLIGRIAVLKEFRGQNYGDFVVRMMVRRAFDNGATEVNLHAQLAVKGFYEKLGFKPYGEIYKEAGIDHINMKRDHDFGGCCCE